MNLIIDRTIHRTIRGKPCPITVSLPDDSPDDMEKTVPYQCFLSADIGVDFKRVVNDIRHRELPTVT